MGRATDAHLLFLYGVSSENGATRFLEIDVSDPAFPRPRAHCKLEVRVWPPDARQTAPCLEIGVPAVQALVKLEADGAMSNPMGCWLACVAGMASVTLCHLFNFMITCESEKLPLTDSCVEILAILQEDRAYPFVSEMKCEIGQVEADGSVVWGQKLEATFGFGEAEAINRLATLRRK